MMTHSDLTEFEQLYLRFQIRVCSGWGYPSTLKKNKMPLHSKIPSLIFLSVCLTGSTCTSWVLSAVHPNTVISPFHIKRGFIEVMDIGRDRISPFSCSADHGILRTRHVSWLSTDVEKLPPFPNFTWCFSVLLL